jgi:hypothetical protein
MPMGLAGGRGLEPGTGLGEVRAEHVKTAMDVEQIPSGMTAMYLLKEGVVFVDCARLK